MVLVEILLPVTDRTREELQRLTKLMTERFGGVTAFTRSPGEGLWQDQGRTIGDQIIVLGVMCETLDAAWWAELRREIERRLDQDEIIVRSHPIQRV